MPAHVTTAVPPGCYVARMLDGTSRPVIGLDRDGRALVLDTRGVLTSVAALGALVREVAPAEASPAPPTPRSSNRSARREPEPVVEEPEPAEESVVNPWLALRERAQKRHLSAVD